MKSERRAVAGGWWLVAGVIAAMATGGCKPQPPSTPDGAYRFFVQAVAHARQTGSGAEVLELFDTPTRAMLQARALQAAQASGKALPADPGWQMLLGDASAGTTADVKVISSSADAATLQIGVDGGPGGTVKMVREQGKWKVHLDPPAAEAKPG